MNNNFSIKRVAMLARYDFTRWQAFVKLILLMAAFLIASDYLQYLTIFAFDSTSAALTKTPMALMFFTGNTVCFMGTFCVAANMAKPFADKMKRIEYLKLPASNAEKFVWRLMMSTVVIWTAVFAAVMLAGVANIPLTGVKSLAKFMPAAIVYNGTTGMENVAAYTVLLWNMSLALLGCCCWVEKTYFKTICSILALMLLCSVLPMQTLIGFDMGSLIFNLNPIILRQLDSVDVAVLAVFIVANVAMGYRLFSRTQIVERRLPWAR